MSQHNLVWMDLEMTGLDPEVDQIIEIATIITNPELEIIDAGPNIAVHCPAERLEKMDEWNRTHHTESGLWDKCIESKIAVAEAEDLTLKFIAQYTEKSANHLCGNSIWQDRRFIKRHMPRLDEYLHYRMLDVSSIKLISNYWFPQLDKFSKKESHRALDDIKESIAELEYYRKSIFQSP